MPETYELLKEWRRILDDYSKRLDKPKIMIIEGMEEIEDIIHYYGTIHEKIAEIPMNFQFYKVTPTSTGVDIQEIIDAWLKKMPMGKFPNYVISSHDFPRVASRLGSILASSLQMIILLLPGIPICYYGDELGMENVIISPEEMKDSFALRTKPSNSRDPMRTPMQWNPGKNAGFTDCDKPWLPININYGIQNVEVEMEDVFSFLGNFKRLVKLRREPSMLLGTFEYALVDVDIFSFTRSIVGAKCYLIIVNMNRKAVSVNLAAKLPSLPETARLILTNPCYYEKLLSNRNELSDYNESSSSSDTRNSIHPAENRISIALNNLKLESYQATDESTDINDTAQLVLFIRGVDENFEITEELACMRSLKGTTKGCDIFREFQEGLLTLKVPITNVCNITTDGAPNMTGKKSGFLGLFNQNYPGHNVVFLHCVIHQDTLCKSALNMKPVLDTVVKLVNTIRSRGLTHRQFRDFLQSVQSEYSDVLYYTKVR
ncbi:Maltase A3 [Araneus ventricosus]|uniref:Maltase A3 n=1 Tax=Araneus ventricosus TaxID=182803 RepID=A0A4Y2QPK4_ARAVE|nr:Maltase A3 [Araneus ventricosus]